MIPEALAYSSKSPRPLKRDKNSKQQLDKTFGWNERERRIERRRGVTLLPPGGNDLDGGLEGVVGELEADLVVALASAPM